MNMVSCSYSDLNYRNNQNYQTEILKGMMDLVNPVTREWLVGTEFYNENKDILNRERLAGYALWKPFVILKTMELIDYGDVVLYMDCGDIPLIGITEFIKKEMVSHDMILLGAGNILYSNKYYTKRDCFYFMGCDRREYWDAIQLEDGVIVIKKTENNLEILQEWLFYCKDKRIITDEPNVCGLSNFEGFVDHRHDQSILTNLSVSHNLHIDNKLRDYLSINKLFHIEGEEATNGMAKWDNFGNRLKQ